MNGKKYFNSPASMIFLTNFFSWIVASLLDVFSTQAALSSGYIELNYYADTSSIINEFYPRKVIVSITISLFSTIGLKFGSRYFTDWHSINMPLAAWEKLGGRLFLICILLLIGNIFAVIQNLMLWLMGWNIPGLVFAILGRHIGLTERASLGLVNAILFLMLSKPVLEKARSLGGIWRR